MLAGGSVLWNRKPGLDSHENVVHRPEAVGIKATHQA